MRWYHSFRAVGPSLDGWSGSHVTRGLPRIRRSPIDATYDRLDGVSLLRCLRCGAPLAILAHPEGSTATEVEELWEDHLADVAQLAREHQCLGRRGHA
jgi:hypothetical protein